MKQLIEITNLDGLSLIGTLNQIKNNLEELKVNFQPKEPDSFISRKDTAKFFGVSTVTIDDWAKKGILKSYKVANRVYFKRSELEAAFKEVKTAKQHG